MGSRKSGGKGSRPGSGSKDIYRPGDSAKVVGGKGNKGRG